MWDLRQFISQSTEKSSYFHSDCTWTINPHTQRCSLPMNPACFHPNNWADSLVQLAERKSTDISAILTPLVWSHWSLLLCRHPLTCTIMMITLSMKHSSTNFSLFQTVNILASWTTSCEWCSHKTLMNVLHLQISTLSFTLSKMISSLWNNSTLITMLSRKLLLETLV